MSVQNESNEYIRYRVRLVVRGPGLLMQTHAADALPLPGDNRFDTMAREKKERGGAPRPPKVYLSPADTKRQAAKRGAYIDARDGFYIPAANLRSLLKDASQQAFGQKLGTRLQTGVDAEPTIIPLMHPEVHERLCWRDDLGEHGQAQSADGAYYLYVAAAGHDAKGKYTKFNTSRVLLTQWEAEFTAVYDRAFIDERNAAAMEDVWRSAGKYVGLMGWRPGAPKGPGRFGMFTLLCHERQE